MQLYIEDLKIGTVSDSDGRFVPQDLPEGTYAVGVRLLGYIAGLMRTKKR